MSVETHDLASLALQHLPLLTCRVDAEGRIAAAAGEAMRSRGLRPEELLGEAVLDRLPELAGKLDQLAPGARAEFVCRGAQGGAPWALRYWLASQEDGSVLVFCLDVTQEDVDRAALVESRAELEQRVRDRTSALEEINNELEAFAYSVSHDLRAPLRIVKGFADELALSASEELSETSAGYVQRISNASGRLDSMIQDLLAFSSVARERMPLTEVDLSEVASDAVALLRLDPKAPERTIDVDPDLPAVIAHGPTLRQVIENLVSNGLKFARPGLVPAVHVGAELDGGVVRVWVQDNGIGIEEEHRERIFGVFERLHGVVQYPGTGIGLAIVRRAVLRMGGRVGVDSVPGEGSRFWFELQPAEPVRS